MQDSLPHFHPYLGAARDPSRATGHTTEPHPPYYFDPNSITAKAAHLQAYGYRQVGLLDSKNHPCDFPGCTMRFKRLEHLKRHYRVHTLEKPFVCSHEGCGKAFSRSDNLNQHLKTHERRAQKQSQYKILKS
ncbi:hypothetical protein K493DRAFT_321142 [Basidiobolus meristosporus CBS 931.73]|uniref:C2H2-type domain-containing protein n=1 Tax=Basidiobolus meristosporus CBS 931.73 TaxID=1314790 RepID=A0A1Y1WZI8_9FUNG|nr:hypothetical protein K493DRAFT_321142 [Basidiobolus meristosporus CBS 931.73]|eukprot:ORX78852.1 hypothetical protein K493DRAFT_321142 [Basidiobolus meristosporus CBS 931.73]